MSATDIWFIIVSYYSKSTYLAKLSQTLAGYNVVIVENTPGYHEKTSVTEKAVLVVQENTGFTGGANRGMRYALDHGAQWLVILNNDIDISQEGLKSLVRMMTQSQASLMGTAQGYVDDVRWTSIQKYPSEAKHVESKYLSGSCLCVHRDIIKAVGYLHEPYFMYYEDVEYSLRTKSKGFPLVHIHIADFHHEENQSIQKNSFLHQYYLARNHLLFVERNAPIAVKLHEFARMPKTLTEHFQKGERGSLVGIRDYALRRFGIYKGGV